jgi:hypothetical protein
MMANCMKKPYTDLVGAKTALRIIRQRSKRRDKPSPTGAYLCAACRRWHLTSKSGVQTPPWLKHR